MTKDIQKLIDNFGGLTALARALGHKNPTTVQGWKQKGRIPDWRIAEVLHVAEKNGIELPPAFQQNGQYKVLISDDLSAESIEVFEKYGIATDVKVGLTPQELADIIGEYDGLAIRSATKVTPEILQNAKNLRIVGRAGIGVDNVDIPCATEKGVIVMNTPLGNSITTAEHTIAMMMAVARKIPQAHKSTTNGLWEKKKFVGTELFNKTLGLVGVGNIGSIVANRAKGLHMNVIAYDPFLSEKRATELGITAHTLEKVLEKADFISVHTPLTKDTKGLLNTNTIALCKDGVYLINCARGGIIEESAVLKALEIGKVAGCALDVFEKEPATDNPLLNHPNVVATPHLGASTTEAQENVAVQVAEQICQYLLNGTVTNALNTPSVSTEDSRRLRPHIALGGIMGDFLGQMIDNRHIKSIGIEFEGTYTKLDTQPIIQAIITGILRPYNEHANMVNASIIATEKNIDISTTTHERNSDYSTALQIIITLDDTTLTLGGSLFGDENPRITNINGIALEAELGKHMLYVKNKDSIGHIAELGTVLALNDINIAAFALGRDNESNQAIALIQTDEPIPTTVLKNINALPTTIIARALKF